MAKTERDGSITSTSERPGARKDFSENLWSCNKEELIRRLAADLRTHVYENPTRFLDDNLFLCRGQGFSDLHINDVQALVPMAKTLVSLIESESYKAVGPSSVLPYIPDNASTAQMAPIYGDYFITNNRFYAESANSPLWIYHEDIGIWKQDGEKFIQKQLVKLRQDKFSTKLVTEVRNYVCYMSYDSDVKLGSCLDKMVVKNGTINIMTGNFSSDFHPDEYHITTLPVTYDPNADCPNFKKFLNEVLIKEEDIMAIQEFFGYCLYKTNAYDIVILLNGSGSNGKTILLGILRCFLGHENVTSVSPQVLDQTFQTVRLVGKLANIAGDIPQKPLKDTGMFKQATSTDLIAAEKKFCDGFTFENYAKFIFSCNVVPASYDSTDAYYRRWRTVDFLKTFDPSMPNYVEKPVLMKQLTSEEELSGILNYALEGLARLLTTYELSGTSSVGERKADMIFRSDWTKYFFDKYLVQNIDSEEIEKQTLYRIYVDWCHAIHKASTSDGWFGKRLLREVSFASDARPRDDGGRKQVWCGFDIDFDAMNRDIYVVGQGSQGGQGISSLLISTEVPIIIIREKYIDHVDHYDQDSKQENLGEKPSLSEDVILGHLEIFKSSDEGRLRDACVNDGYLAEEFEILFKKMLKSKHPNIKVKNGTPIRYSWQKKKKKTTMASKKEETDHDEE